MAKQVIVVGLGRFGLTLARVLTERGAEVLAVDAREDRVRTASSFAAEAACFDVTDSEALARASPAQRDACICAIGDDSKESSIICTALLRQMGAPRVIARANDPLHARILQLVGAHEVVNPIHDFGERFAHRLVYDRLISEMPLGEDLVISEIHPPASLVGHTLAELKLPQRYSVTVVAVRQKGHGAVVLPNPNETLKADDILIVVSHEGAIPRLMEQT
jgi:trk system potassium uptake protein TrkA